MSHAWGTAPITGVVNGLLGLAQTSPAYKTFSVKPLLGGVARAKGGKYTAGGGVLVRCSSTTQHGILVSYFASQKVTRPQT